MIEIAVSKTSAVCTGRQETLTSGRVGLVVKVWFSPEWRGLCKTAVADGSGQVLEAVVGEDDTFVVPHECMAQAGSELKLGLYGMSQDGTVVIPTVYCALGMIQPGAVPPGETGLEATPSAFNQLMTTANQAIAAAETAQTSAQTAAEEAGAAADRATESAQAAQTSAQTAQTAAAKAVALGSPDTTLTVAGAPADAAAVGKAIRAINTTGTASGSGEQGYPEQVCTRWGTGFLTMYTNGGEALVTGDGDNLYKNGKNLLPAAAFTADKSAYGFGKLTLGANGKLHMDGGTPTANMNFYYNTASVSYQKGVLLPAGTYTLSVVDEATGTLPDWDNTAGYGLFYWYASDTSSRKSLQYNYRSAQVQTVTLTEKAYVLPFFTWSKGTTFAETTLDVQLELGQEATDFVACAYETGAASEEGITMSLCDGDTYLWSDGGTVTAKLTEVGVVNNGYLPGDVRRYGIFPDGVTNWQETLIPHAIQNSVNLGLEIYWPAGYYASQLLIMRSNVQMRFGEGAVFGGLIHVVSPYSQDSSDKRHIENITLRGTVSTFSRYGQTDAKNVTIEKLHLRSDETLDVDNHLKGRGVHIYWGNEGFRCDEMVVDDCDHNNTTLDAAVAIDGYGANPTGFHIGKIHIKNSDIHGLYLTGGGHYIGEVVVDAYGASEYTGVGLQDADGKTQSQALKGVWLNRIWDSYIGKITVDQCTDDDRPNAVCHVLVDETGQVNLQPFGSVHIGQIVCHHVTGNGVALGDGSYPAQCYAHVGSILVECTDTGTADEFALGMGAKTKAAVQTLFTKSLGSRTAMKNDTTSQIGAVFEA